VDRALDDELDNRDLMKITAGGWWRWVRFARIVRKDTNLQAETALFKNASATDANFNDW